MSATLRVIVAGAGLGGLTLANSLAREGFEVCVLEQAQALGEVGAGVQISANGARVLHFLGLEERLREVAFTPERGEVRHWQTGEVLATRPLGNTSLERFGFPYYHLHRADFHRVLAESVEKMPNVSIHLNQKIVDLNQDNIAVTASTEVGSVFDADVVIGCDGIHSAVRTALFGPDQPRFTGCVAWRATIPTERLPKGHVRPAASNWIGKGGHFVHYYLRGGALVNCVGVTEQDQWAAESWSSRGKQGDFLSDFVEWHEDLKLLIQNADNCYRWGLFDRDPMQEWSQGRATLLGDACHAMLPFMAQGAVMAVEDAYTVTQCLAARPDNVPAALKRYERLRRDRTAKVQQMSRDNIEFFHNADISNLEERLDSHRDAHLWLYGYDVTRLDFCS